MPKARLRRARRRFMSSARWRVVLIFWVGAILVGLAATLLAWGSDLGYQLFLEMTGASPYLPLVVVPAGLMLIAFLMHFFPGSQGSGIPQAIAALQVRERHVRSELVSLRIGLGKMLMVSLGLVFGASIGREGPTVHVGVAIMDSLRRFVNIPHHDYRRWLILAGGSAGLAAAFNTPLAGVVFAIEEMSHSFEERAAGMVMTAVILAGMIALAVQGKYTYFGTVYVDVDLMPGITAVLLCGILGGFFGGTFSALLVWVNRRTAPWRRHHPMWIAGACGLGVAVLGVASGGSVFGTGYEEARMALTGEGHLAGPFPLLKWGATLLSYWSGIPGGIFAPSLSIGAGLGYDLAPLVPAAPVAAVVLLGMVGYFTGVVQTPLTAVIIVTEMTDDQAMLLPIMATALIAKGVSRFLSPQPVYRALAEDFMHSLARTPPPTQAKLAAIRHKKAPIRDKKK